MTRRTALRCLAAFVWTALAAAAADLNGKWSGTSVGPHGAEPVLLILKAAGPEVTGTIGPNEDRQFPLEDARLDGARLTCRFKGPHGAAFHLELRLEGGALKGSGTRSAGGETETSTLELKRNR